MKKLFFFALMLGMAVCNFSCSSDDDGGNGGNNNSGNKGNQTEGIYADKVAEYTIPEAEAPEIITDDNIKVQLTGFNLTEYGKGILELVVDGGINYETFDVVIDGNKYLLSQNGISAGFIEFAEAKTKTRAGSNAVELKFNLSFQHEVNGEMVPITFDNIAQAQQVIDYVNTTYTSNITNAWGLERMKLTITFDDKSKTPASTNTQGGDLRPFIDLAKKNDVTISEKDEKELTRTITSLIIDKSKLFVLEYEEGGSDAATWKWITENEKNLAIGIKLKDGKTMGNKFFNDDSQINVQLRDNGKINLILSTYLEDDKCTASLLVNLK